MPLRSTLVGAASGVVLLAGVVGFAVGLPEITGDEAAAHTDEGEETPTGGVDTPMAELLPDSLLNGALVRLTDAGPEYQETAEQVELYGSDKLTEAFDTDVATGIYVPPQLDGQVSVTLYEGQSGLFLQQGAPIPPEMSVGTQNVADLRRVGDSVCIGQWDPEAYASDSAPYQAQCQRSVGGVTVNVYATPGITLEDTAAMVDEVAAFAGLE